MMKEEKLTVEIICRRCLIGGIVVWLIVSLAQYVYSTPSIETTLINMYKGLAMILMTIMYIIVGAFILLLIGDICECVYKMYISPIIQKIR